MAFAAGYKGHECLARSANTFQLRAHHIGHGDSVLGEVSMDTRMLRRTRGGHS